MNSPYGCGNNGNGGDNSGYSHTLSYSHTVTYTLSSCPIISREAAHRIVPKRMM